MRIKIFFTITIIYSCSHFVQTQELVIQNGHSSGALLMDVSFDGRYLITSGADINSLIGDEFSDLPYDYFKKTDEQNGLIIYDIYTGKILRYCQNSRGGINSISASKIDYSFATGDYFGNITIFDLNGEVSYYLTKKNENLLPYCLVNCLRFFNSSNKLIACYSDSTTVIWDLRTQMVLKRFKLNSNIKLLDISKDDLSIVFASENGMIGVIGLIDGNITYLDRAESEVVALQIKQNYSYILRQNDLQNELVIWNLKGGKKEKNYIIDEPIFTRGKFTNNCEKLFASKWSGGLLEINCENGLVENNNVSNSNDFVYCLTITPDDKLCIFSQPNAKEISFYDINFRSIVKTIKNNFNWVISVNFLSESKSFIATAGKNIYCWDAAYCKILNSLTFNSEIYSLVVSKDGKYSAAGTSNGDVIIMNNFDCSYQKLNLLEAAVYALDFSGDNKKLAISSDKLYILDLDTYKIYNTFLIDNTTIKTLKFITNTEFIAVGGFDKKVKVYNFNEGRLIKVLNEVDGIVMCADISNNDLIAFYSAGKGIYIYENTSLNFNKFIKFDSSLLTTMKFYNDKIIVGDWNGDIYSIDIVLGTYEKLFSYNSTILKIDISNDNRFLISGGTDGSIKLWDLNSKSELATFISVDSLDYLTLIPENYYTVSKNGYKAIGFRIGNRAYPFEQFDLIYNRPDLVYKKIGILSSEEIDFYKKIYDKRIKKSGFQNIEEQGIFKIPEIKILNTNVQAVTDDNVFNLDFSASCGNENFLKDIIITVNNVPYKKIGLKDRSAKYYTTILPIELSFGKNRIGVSCINDKGIESLKEVIEIISTKKLKQDLYILSFGVSNYLDNSGKLNYANKDAIDFSELFLSEKVKDRFNNIRIVTYIDSQVTRENVLSSKKILQESGVNDMVIVFFAGHGLLNKDGNFYFGTYDINFKNPELRGINYDEIESIFDNIGARTKILFMDACHSGDLDEDEYKSYLIMKRNIDSSNLIVSSSIRGDEITDDDVNKDRSKSIYEFMKELFNDLSKSTGTVIISASSGLSYAYESPELKNGVFTYSIIKGLRYLNADYNQDGKIFFSELRNFIIENVKRLTNNGQKPTIKKENIEYDYQIW